MDSAFSVYLAKKHGGSWAPVDQAMNLTSQLHLALREQRYNAQAAAACGIRESGAAAEGDGKEGAGWSDWPAPAMSSNSHHGTLWCRSEPATSLPRAAFAWTCFSVLNNAYVGLDGGHGPGRSRQGETDKETDLSQSNSASTNVILT